MSGWICPWGICNEHQAQACREEASPSKGCGGMFPAGFSVEQAQQMIRPRPGTPVGAGDGCGTHIPRQLTEADIRRIVREELDRRAALGTSTGEER